jgi:hypothetical protein
MLLVLLLLFLVDRGGEEEKKESCVVHGPEGSLGMESCACGSMLHNTVTVEDICRASLVEGDGILGGESLQ